MGHLSSVLPGKSLSPPSYEIRQRTLIGDGFSKQKKRLIHVRTSMSEGFGHNNFVQADRAQTADRLQNLVNHKYSSFQETPGRVSQTFPESSIQTEWPPARQDNRNLALISPAELMKFSQNYPQISRKVANSASYTRLHVLLLTSISLRSSRRQLASHEKIRKSAVSAFAFTSDGVYLRSDDEECHTFCVNDKTLVEIATLE